MGCVVILVTGHGIWLISALGADFWVCLYWVCAFFLGFYFFSEFPESVMLVYLLSDRKCSLDLIVVATGGSP